MNTFIENLVLTINYYASMVVALLLLPLVLVAYMLGAIGKPVMRVTRPYWSACVKRLGKWLISLATDGTENSNGTTSQNNTN